MLIRGQKGGGAGILIGYFSLKLTFFDNYFRVKKTFFLFLMKNGANYINLIIMKSGKENYLTK